MKKRNILAIMTVLTLSAYPLTGCDSNESTEVETRTTTNESEPVDDNVADTNTNTSTNENEEMSTSANNQTDSSNMMAHNGVDHSKDKPHSQDPMMKSMMKSMDKMKTMPMTGHPDQDFAAMMIPHHQGAIDMAKLELKSGKDAAMKKMAQDIISAQQKEIKELQAFVDKFKANHKDATAHKVNMSDPFNKKMMDSMKMDMSKHHAENTDISFASLMIPHHEHAVKMAQAVIAHGKDPAIKKMAQKIITDQQKEIKVLQAWLDKNH